MDNFCEECGDELEESDTEFCKFCIAEASGWDDPDNENYLIDGVGFADPSGISALRAATDDNPRDRSCPTCGRENILTRIDEMRGYQCDSCADAAESF